MIDLVMSQILVEGEVVPWVRQLWEGLKDQSPNGHTGESLATSAVKVASIKVFVEYFGDAPWK